MKAYGLVIRGMSIVIYQMSPGGGESVCFDLGRGGVISDAPRRKGKPAMLW